MYEHFNCKRFTEVMNVEASSVTTKLSVKRTWVQDYLSCRLGWKFNRVATEILKKIHTFYGKFCNH